MDLIKSLFLSAAVLTGAYLLGRHREKYLNIKKEKDQTDDILEAAKKAANLSDADCDALHRMYDKFDG